MSKSSLVSEPIDRVFVSLETVRMKPNGFRVKVPTCKVEPDLQEQATAGYLPHWYEVCETTDGRKVLFRNGRSVGFLSR